MFLLKKREKVLLLAFLGLILIASGVYLYRHEGLRTDVPLPAISKLVSTAPKAQQDTKEIKVDVKGEVQRPGVYSLPSESRVTDAIQAAGGMTEHADQEKVNLAAKLADGGKVDVPSKKQNLPAPFSTSKSSPSSTSSKTSLPSTETHPTQQEVAGTGKINVNTASQTQLDSLPGIGPTRAKEIIDFREQHGPFLQVNDLLNVKGIGNKTLEDLRNLVVVE